MIDLQNRPHLKNLKPLHWLMLSFLAGNLNAGGFMATQRFVSHVTGFATLIGVDLAIGQKNHALGMALIPLFFLAGAIISGITIDRRIYRQQQPRYDIVFGIAAICILLCFLGGIFGAFGAFGDFYEQKRDFTLLALLCLTCGLVNAAITTGTGALIRVTHITGLTTDLGIGLVRFFTFDRDKPERQQEWARNIRRLNTILSFIMGALVGSVFYFNFKYFGFLFPALMLGYFFVISMKLKTTQNP